MLIRIFAYIQFDCYHDYLFWVEICPTSIISVLFLIIISEFCTSIVKVLLLWLLLLLLLLMLLLVSIVPKITILYLLCVTIVTIYYR